MLLLRLAEAYATMKTGAAKHTLQQIHVESGCAESAFEVEACFESQER